MEKAGIDLARDAVVENGPDGLHAVQKGQYGVILDNSILCTLYEMGGGSITGRWLVSAEWHGEGQGLSRAEMVLAVASCLGREDESILVESIQPGYYVEDISAASVSLAPVWIVDAEGEQYIINNMTKKIIET